METDRRLAGLAIALGRRHLGLTWPNPSVGAVVVRDGAVVATGITQPGGRPHAEPVALAAAGESARGATLYVSLEPCSHHGRTPPCAEAIVRAGVARVVTSLEDPDRRVAGRGHAILRAAGIAVTVGPGEAEAARAHLGHVTRVRHGRPAVTVKLARTADGYAARLGGERLLVTGPEANGRTHLARALADAVMVGVSTILADDPRLDVRLPGLGERRPVRVVLDTGLRIPPDARIVRAARQAPTWIVTAADPDGPAAARLREAGAVLVPASAAPDGRLALPAALAALGALGLTRVFCEAGPTLADALAEADLVDEAVIVTGPAALDAPGLPALGPSLAAALGTRLPLVRTEKAGPDRVEIFERTIPCSPAS